MVSSGSQWFLTSYERVRAAFRIPKEHKMHNVNLQDLCERFSYWIWTNLHKTSV